MEAGGDEGSSYVVATGWGDPGSGVLDLVSEDQLGANLQSVSLGCHDVKASLSLLQTSLCGAFAGIVDAQNAAARKLHTTQLQVGSLNKDHGTVFQRMRQFEVRQATLEKELQTGLERCEKTNVDKLTKAIAELEQAQRCTRQTLLATIHSSVSDAERRQFTAQEHFEDRMKALEEAHEALVSRQGDLATVEAPHLLGEVAKLQKLAQDLERRATKRATEEAGFQRSCDERVAAVDSKLAAQSATLRSLQDAFQEEQRETASQIAPLDASLQAARKESEECKSLATSLVASVKGLEEHVRSREVVLQERVAKIVEELSSRVRQELQAQEDARLAKLERVVEEGDADRSRFAERVLRELNRMREDTRTGREWAHQRFEIIAEWQRRLEGEQWRMESRVNGGAPSLGVDVHEHLSGLRSRQDQCEEAVARFTSLVCDLSTSVEISELMTRSLGDLRGPAATTQCLSCGRRTPSGAQSPSLRGRSPSPTHAEAVGLSDSLTAPRGGISRHGGVDDHVVVGPGIAVGPGHVACRAAAGSSRHVAVAAVGGESDAVAVTATAGPASPVASQATARPARSTAANPGAMTAAKAAAAVQAVGTGDAVRRVRRPNSARARMLCVS